ADGIAFAEFADEKAEDGSARRLIFSEKFADPISGFTIPEIEPRLFSFNNPFGACPACDGLGSQRAIDPGLIIPDDSLALRSGAVAPWAKSSSPYYHQTLQALGKAYGFKLGDRWRDLPEAGRDAILNGTGERQIAFDYDDGLRSYTTSKTFEGIIPNLERRWKETDSAWAREEIERY
ncbi:MAG: excinuclease ABC subunit A, partial [Alphaproteobacteria bacterium]|nr:excinuclease ABC subunit A [Alphaproteobacteria bacterium]